MAKTYIYFAVVVLLAAVNAELAPEAAVEGVVDLTTANWDEQVKNSPNAVLLEFYAPWCGWCKKVAPIFAELGKAVVKSGAPITIAKFDATQPDSNDIKTKYGVRGFPTILFLSKDDKETPVKFAGQRTVEGFLEFLGEKTGIKIQADGSGFTEEATGAAAAPEEKKASTASVEVKAGEGVVDLNPDNFDAIVMNNEHDVFVKFYAPWCGHCQRMVPAWDELGKLSKDVVVAKLDAAAHREVASRFGVRGFPTLKLFKKNDKANPVQHTGGRDTPSLKKFLDDQKTA